MTNHARTLLLNIDGNTGGYIALPGEEFIPPTFRAQELPEYLSRIHGTLFGSTPSRLMLNYRARQFMGILHNTELEEFVLSLDSRITYDVLPRDDLYLQQFFPSVINLEGTQKELSLIDEVGGPDQSGRTDHQWRVTVLTGSTVQVERVTPPASTVVQDYALAQGLSSLIQLHGSGLQARFEEGVGSDWLVTASARPERDITDLVRDLDGFGADLDIAFGVGTESGAREPFLTFRNLWQSHPEQLYRFGGALMAWIYRADILLREGN